MKAPRANRVPDSRGALAAQPWLEEVLAASAEGIALFGPDGRIVRHNDRLAVMTEQLPGVLDGLAIDDLFDDPAYRLALAAARGRGYWTGQLRSGERELRASLRVSREGYGALFCQDVSERVELGRRAASLAALVELQRSRAESARELALEQSERLTTVFQMTLDALEAPTLRDTAARICEALVGDDAAENVALYLYDAEQGQLRRIAARGERAAGLPEVFSRDEAPNAGDALDTGRAVPISAGGVLDGFAVFPLTGGRQSLGVVAIDRADDLDKLQIYAVHAGAAVNNALLAERLALANQELREIDRQRTDFLNDIAHDLRTPLTCIRTYADLIQMYVDEPPETYAEFLAVITDEIERLGELLDNFLDLARLDSATMRYEPEPVRVDEIAAHFEHVYRARAEAEEIELRLEPAEEIPVILADRRRIEQVFSNLLSNAMKHTPPGGRVAIAVRRDERGVRVEVSDTGPGVPPEERQRIFERFRQARGSDSSGGGTGLGLAIAEGIVSHHGGRIWVEDAPGGGARFVFWLPIEPDPQSLLGQALR